MAREPKPTAPDKEADRRIVWIPIAEADEGYFMPARLDKIKALKWQPYYVDRPPQGAVLRKNTPEYLEWLIAS